MAHIEMNGLQNFPVFRGNIIGHKSYWLEIIVVPNQRTDAVTLFRAYGQAKNEWTLSQLLDKCLQAKKLDFGIEKTITFKSHNFSQLDSESNVQDGLYFAFIACDYKQKAGKGINLGLNPILTGSSASMMIQRLSEKLYDVHRPHFFTALEYAEIVNPFFVIEPLAKKSTEVVNTYETPESNSVKEVIQSGSGGTEEAASKEKTNTEERTIKNKVDKESAESSQGMNDKDIHYLIAFIVFGILSFILSKIEIVNI